MTDEGVKDQPAAEAQPAAAPPAADAPTSAMAPPLPAPVPEAPPAPAVPETSVAIEAAPAAVETVPVSEVPADVPVALRAQPVTEAVPAALPAAPARVRRPHDFRPMLEYASWRLVEMVSTLAVAAVLLALLLRADGPGDVAIVADRLLVTVPLVIFAGLIATITGLPLGYAAARNARWVDMSLRGLSVLGTNLAPLWLAGLLTLLFAGTLQWLQPAGFVPWLQSPIGALASLTLPALALGLPLGAELALQLRDALRRAETSPALDVAFDMGIQRAEAFRQIAVRQALADVAYRMMVPLALLVPASMIIESVFYLPGLGRLVLTALQQRDFGTLQLGLLTLVLLVCLCRLLLLMLRAAADPRIARRA